jgi:hypothetical protein
MEDRDRPEDDEEEVADVEKGEEVGGEIGHGAISIHPGWECLCQKSRLWAGSS